VQLSNIGRGFIVQRSHRVWICLALWGGLFGCVSAGSAQEDEAIGFERTPPRLSLVDGSVSFSRTGAAEWAPARVNTPLAPGDELYAGAEANLELQVGARAYVRAGEDTQLGLTNLEPDFLQFRVAAGHVSLDLRSLTASQTIEFDTPNAAFTIERTGYYRVEVDGDSTSFVTRRGGRAAVTPASGASAAIEPSEQVVVTGTGSPTLETYAAPSLDAWDRWNYARTDDLLDAVSARYVSPGVYGVADLDHYGYWRVVPTYGAVWVPRGVAVGWVPYSTGRWIYDPFYGWSWVDAAPWGWAPYHYGRWVYVSGFWAWAPGPVVRRVYYAPALVAFFGGGGFSLGITIGTPTIGWTALGWGEPIVPWWGPVGFRGHPYWAGWRGPRIVNKVVVKRTVVVKAADIHVYQNARDHHALVTVRRDRFGRRDAGKVEFGRGDAAKLEPFRGDLAVKPDRSSLVAARGRAPHPPRGAVDRPVVATRAPRADTAPGLGPVRRPRTDAQGPAPQAPPPARVVKPSREGRRIVAPERPPFGRKGDVEREMPPPPPRFRDVRREEAAPAPSERSRRPAGEAPPSPRVVREPGRQARPAPEAPVGRPERAAPRQRELPGESANRVWRSRSGGGHGSSGGEGRPHSGARPESPARGAHPGKSQPAREQAPRGAKGSAGR
jgi:hypothetical protein